MKLIRVNSLPPKVIQGLPGRDGRDGIDGRHGTNGRDGRDGKDGITQIVEKVADLVEFQEQVTELKKQFDWLKKRNPEPAQGGGRAVAKYIFTEQQVTHFTRSSFLEGITIIGVRYSGAATVYLPHNLDPTMIVSVKDEAGSGNITILVE